MWQGEEWQWRPPAGSEGRITEEELELRLQRLIPEFDGYPAFQLAQAMAYECNKFGFPKKAQSYYEEAARLIPDWMRVHDPDFDPLGR